MKVQYRNENLVEITHCDYTLHIRPKQDIRIVTKRNEVINGHVSYISYDCITVTTDKKHEKDISYTDILSIEIL